MPIIDKIQLSGTVYTIGSENSGVTSGEVQTMIDNSLSGYVTTDTLQDITVQKTFVGDPSNSKKSIKFKQYNNASKVGFVVVNSAETNNEVASFEFRPNTFTIDGVQHPLMYFGHYRNTNIANAGVPQTVIGFRQYDQLNAAAYHYVLPLPEKAKAPFSLTTSFKDFYMPLGIKVDNSTMVKADSGGVMDISSYIGGGGKAVAAGTNISVTTGETADTINCTIPFENSSNNLLLGYNLTVGGGTYYSLGISPKDSDTSIQTKISGNNAIAIGHNVTITGGTGNRGELSTAIGHTSKVYGVQSTALGVGCNANGNMTLAIGRYSTSKGNDSVAIGNQANVSGNSSVAIGRLAKVSGDSSVAIGSGATADGVEYKMNLNNQIKVTPSNQVYISNSANTSTYCLQEKIENTETALGGLSLVKLTQAQYDALATKDSNVLYVIVG